MDAARLTTAQFTLLLAHDLLRTSLCLFPLSSTLVRDCSDSRAGERQATGTVVAKCRQAGSVGRYHPSFLPHFLMETPSVVSEELLCVQLLKQRQWFLENALESLPQGHTLYCFLTCLLPKKLSKNKLRYLKNICYFTVIGGNHVLIGVHNCFQA